MNFNSEEKFQKNLNPVTFKDFEYLKFMNTTSLKDPVLEEFLEKAKEMEQAAGPALTVNSSQFVKPKTYSDALKEFNSNPLRYYTVTDFNKAIKSFVGSKS